MYLARSPGAVAAGPRGAGRFLPLTTGLFPRGPDGEYRREPRGLTERPEPGPDARTVGRTTGRTVSATGRERGNHRTARHRAVRSTPRRRTETTHLPPVRTDGCEGQLPDAAQASFGNPETASQRPVKVRRPVQARIGRDRRKSRTGRGKRSRSGPNRGARPFLGTRPSTGAVARQRPPHGRRDVGGVLTARKRASPLKSPLDSTHNETMRSTGVPSGWLRVPSGWLSSGSGDREVDPQDPSDHTSTRHTRCADCPECGRQTEHRISVQVRGADRLLDSQRPCRVGECLDCGYETELQRY